MAFLVTPITIDGEPLCPDAVTRLTSAVLSGSASQLSDTTWQVWRAQCSGDSTSNPTAATEDIVTGSVLFGCSAASSLTLTLNGVLEGLNSEYDNIEVLHNGTRVFFAESESTSTTNAWDTISSGPHTVVIPLPERPCGHIIEIRGSSVDEVANNGTGWIVSVSAS